jgi:hypothetical protein
VMEYWSIGVLEYWELKSMLIVVGEFPGTPIDRRAAYRLRCN